jgi:hypothetical protein
LLFDLVTQVKLVDIRNAQFETRARIRIDLGDQINTRQYASSVWWMERKFSRCRLSHVPNYLKNNHVPYFFMI